MECRVLTILSILCLIRNCFGANDIEKHLEAAAEEPSSRIQSCLKNIIEHIWSPSDSLVFTISSHPDYVPVYLPNPVTVVDIRIPIPNDYKTYGVNYVIEAHNYTLFARTLDRIRPTSLWHKMDSPKGKFVILTKEEQKLTSIFTSMWRVISALHVLVVIYDDTSKNRPTKIITCNPHMQENGCATNPTVFSKHTCDNIRIDFLKPVRNYNECPVYVFPPLRPFTFDLKSKRGVMMWNILVHINVMLNASVIIIDAKADQFQRISQEYDIVLIEHYFGKAPGWENSIVYVRRQLVWIGPPLKESSRLKALFRPFKYDMWLATLFMTILFVFLRWAIIRNRRYNNHWNNLAGAFTDIIGLTFGVSINRIPNIMSLKIMIGFYLIYIIHIHTAYNSDLINVLVVPKYEGKISSVEEVAESGIPIYMHYNMLVHYFSDDTYNNSILSKINKLARPIDLKDNSVPIDPSKVFIVVIEDSFNTNEGNNFELLALLRQHTVNVFFSNSFLGDVKNVFVLKNGSYFVESLNSVITFLHESGLYSANIPMQYEKGHSMYNHYNTEPELHEVDLGLLLMTPTINKNWQQPIGLDYLISLFVIFSAGLGFSTVVFVAEICIHKMH